MATGVTKTFEGSAVNGTRALYMKLTMTETYNATTGVRSLAFTKWQFKQAGFSNTTSYLIGTLTAKVNGETYTLFSDADGSTTAPTNKVPLYTSDYNDVRNEADTASWSYTISDIANSTDGSLSVVVTWSGITTNSTKNYNLSISGTETVTLTTVAPRFALTISAGTGSTITVNRTSSPKGGGSTGDLSDGATIYYGDVLKITFTASTGYNIGTHTVNGTAFTSGGSHTVSAAVKVVSTATVKSFTLTISAGTGSTITVNRTSSPKQGATTGNLSSGAKIYYSDVLKVTFAASTGYNLGTHTVNSSTFTSGGTHTVTAAVTVASTATVKSYTLTISKDDHSTATVSRTSSPLKGATTGAIANNATIYHGDVLKITFGASAGYEVKTHTVNGSTFTSGNTHTVSKAVAVAVTSAALGLVYIDTGTALKKYLIYIDTGTEWRQYMPYIDDGTAWHMCS